MSIPRIQRNWSLRVLPAAFLVLALFGFQAIAHADDGLTGLAASCETAKADFHPITAADLVPIKADLAAAVKRLDERIAAAGPSGELWRNTFAGTNFNRNWAATRQSAKCSAECINGCPPARKD